MSSAQPWFAALLCCMLPTGLAAERGASTHAGPQTATESDAPRVALADRFDAAFTAWRAGLATALAQVRSLAALRCEQEARCDVPAIVEHYALLSSEQRATGLAFERRAFALHARLNDAFEEGLEDEEWEAVRGPFEADLDQLCEQSRTLADRGARAKGFALRADYFIERLEQHWGERLEPEQRARLAEQVALDAREALADCAAFGIVRGTLVARCALARSEHFSGQFSSARAQFELLARTADSVGNEEMQRDAYRGMLAIARERGDQPEAERCLEELARLSDPREDWPLARDWAMRLLHDDRAEEASRFLEQFHAPDARDFDATARHTRGEYAFTLAQAYLRAGRLEPAREQAAIAAALKTGFEPRYLEARIALAAARPREALALLSDPALLERASAREQGAARTLLGEARLSLHDATGAVGELRRALELGDAQRNLTLADPLLSLDEALRANCIGEWEGAGLETVALLARAQLALGDPLAAALASIDWQSRSLRGGEGTLERLRAQAGVAAPRESINAAHLRAWAASTELGLLSWIVGVDSAAVVHLKLDSDGRLDCAGAELRIGREALREALRRLRERAIAGQDCASLAAEIRDVLLPESLRAHIGKPTSRDDRLLCLLHGPLESAPMELLGLGEQLFDEQLCLIALPGLPALDPGPAPSAQQFSAWQLLGSPLDGQESEGAVRWLLPGASEELNALAQLHPGATLAAGQGFDRRAFERAVRSKQCLHVATHLQSKPGETPSRFPADGLRLSEGDVISAQELADLGPGLPLVVLSACETGAGRYADGEGLFGVARAFLEGGTRNLVVTLWPVEDGAARDFSLAFHRALAAGQSPSRAANSARCALRAAGRSSADWAAFRFLGRD